MAKDFREDLPKPVHDEAVLAFKFAAEKQGLPLHAVDVDWIAAVLARRILISATNAGEVVPKEKHQQEVENMKSRADRFSNWWAGAKADADRQLQRAQTVLSDLPDRTLAENLAEQIGVLLLDEKDALFEVQG
jgi:hypothetical protein